MIQQPVESSGRSFTPDEINLIRQTTRTFSNLSLTELSRTLCELLEWKRPNGKLKWEECRALLERLNVEGIISIPRLRSSGSPGPRRVNTSAHVESEEPVTGSAGQFEPLSLQLVQASSRELSSIFKQLIARWHYLGHKIPFGAYARYLVTSKNCRAAIWLVCSFRARHGRWRRETPGSVGVPTSANGTFSSLFPTVAS